MNTAQSSQSGMFSVSVDNSAPYTVDSFSNSTDAKCGISWSSPPLSNGTHTVSIEPAASRCIPRTNLYSWPIGYRHFIGAELAGGWPGRCLDIRTGWFYVSTLLNVAIAQAYI